MSHYQGFENWDDLHLTQIDYSSPQPAASLQPPAQLAHQLESFATATRSLEANLLKERNYSKQLRDYVGRITAQLQELQKSDASLKQQLADLQRNEAQTSANAKSLAVEYKKVSDELNQYRKVWSEVLNREQEARLIIEESAVNRNKLDQLEAEVRTFHQNYMSEKSKREQAERHAKSYQGELHNVLVRLHSSEAKFSDLTKELQALHEVRKHHQEEMAKHELTLREKYELELVKERGRARLEAENEIARMMQRVQLAEQDREKLRGEMEIRIQQEQERLKTEFSKCMSQERLKAEEGFSKALEDRERRIQDLGQALRDAQAEAARSQTEIGSVRAELAQAQHANSDAQAKAKKQEERAIRAEVRLLEIEEARTQAEAARTQAQEARAQAQELLERITGLEQTLVSKEKRLTALKAECQLMQELLLAEKGEEAQILPAEKSRASRFPVLPGARLDC